jgi:hypothetical protein
MLHGLRKDALDIAITLTYRTTQPTHLRYIITAEEYEHLKDGNGDEGKETVHQEEIDKILDKIRVSGYDSLSKEEKRRLFEASHEK